MYVYVDNQGRMMIDYEASKAALVNSKVATIKYNHATKEVTIEGMSNKPDGDPEGYFMLVTTHDRVYVSMPIGFYGRWADDLGPNYDFKAAGDKAFPARVDGTTIRFTLGPNA